MNQQIILWDDNADRVHRMEPALHTALQKMQIPASIQINCEPPLLSRHQLIGKTPAVQINGGDFWRHTIGEAITEEQFLVLLNKLKRHSLL